MALNRSVRAFIKSPWTQCDFTQLLKKALHTIFFCVTAKHFQTEKNKQKKKQFLVVHEDMMQILQQLYRLFFRGKHLHDCGLEAALKNVTVKYCISGEPLRGDWAFFFSPVTATYCLGLVLRLCFF